MPSGLFEEKGVVYRALAHPRWLELVTGSILAVSTLALLYVLLARYRREKRTLPLSPLFGLLITIWSWSISSPSSGMPPTAKRSNTSFEGQPGHQNWAFAESLSPLRFCRNPDSPVNSIAELCQQ